MKLIEVKITKKWSLFIDHFGYAFTGGFVLFPTVVVSIMKGYKQFTFCWLHKSYDFTFNKHWEKKQ